MINPSVAINSPRSRPPPPRTVSDQVTAGSEVLFVCVHNAGRSQMAAGFLARIG